MIIALAIAAAALQQYEGRIEKVDPAKGKVFMKLLDQSTGSWTLATDAKVIGPDKTSQGLDAIEPFNEAIVKVSEDGEIQQLTLLAHDWAKEYSGGKVVRFDGTIVAIQKAPALTIEILQLGGKEKLKFTLPAQTRFVTGATGHAVEGSAAGLHEGLLVRVLQRHADSKVYEVVLRE